MISPVNPTKGPLIVVLFALLTMLTGCVTSKEPLLNAATTPMKAGKYQIQYLTDGKWTTFGVGSLTLVNRTYAWVEEREAFSLLKSGDDRHRFTLIDIGSDYFIVVTATAELRNPKWIGNYVYGVARRVGDAFLYDLPSCLDLRVSQGFSDKQIEKIEVDECLYSSKETLIGALAAYAKRTAMWKRLAPYSH
ncbi:MAG: hypothetical protein ACXWNQ_09915 [Anaerolineales bacterium]